MSFNYPYANAVYATGNTTSTVYSIQVPSYVDYVHPENAVMDEFDWLRHRIGQITRLAPLR